MHWRTVIRIDFPALKQASFELDLTRGYGFVLDGLKLLLLWSFFFDVARRLVGSFDRVTRTTLALFVIQGSEVGCCESSDALRSLHCSLPDLTMLVWVVSAYLRSGT